MKDNSVFPPRGYYRLAQAAIELECSPDYLIHLAVQGIFTLITPAPSGFCYLVRAIKYDGVVRSKTIQDWTMPSIDFVVLPASGLRLLERYGEQEFMFVDDWWSLVQGPSDQWLTWLESDPPADIDEWTILIEVAEPSHVGKDGSWEPPNEDSKGFLVRSEDLWVPGDEVQRLKRGEAALPIKKIPPEVVAEIHREPGPKSRNAMLRTISALSQALIKSELRQPHKDAEAILAAIAAAGIEAPVKADALAAYLKDSGGIIRG